MFRQKMKGKCMKEQNKKLITQIIAIVLFLLILIISLITIWSTTQASNLGFMKKRYYIMRANSDIANPGDLVIAEKGKIGEIKAGDSIVYKDSKYFYCDKIIEMKDTGSIVKMVIAEKDGIQYQFSEKDISGKIVKVIPNLGTIISFLRTIFGMILYILFVICIYILLTKVILPKKEQRQSIS